MRSELLNASGGSLRTILLSATYTEGAMRTLRAFFSERSKSGASSFRVVSAAQLRPEPAYWVAPVSNETERDRRVMEAIHHLPRPLVLYTTRIEDANRWYGILWQLGFRRVACVTGDTRADDRNRAVQGWRLGHLDLVVATSAFGLGIDNPNVRSVVHACIPETLDRFYQEVGRAGRDGASSVSLLLPTQRDFELATGLNQTKVISIDLGLPRWRSMFHHPDRLIHDHDEYTVRLDVPPGSDARQIDMTSRENTDWNQRTLTLMAGAGLIELVGPVTRTPRYGPDADSVVDGVSQERAYQTVRIVHPGHSDEETWRDLVEPRRQAISGANRLSLRAIERYVRRPDQICIEGILRPLYELPGGDDMPPIAVAKACGGCPTCRASGHAPYAQRLPEPPQPWANWGGVRPPADRELDSRGRLLVFYDEADLRNRRTSRRFTNVLGTLILSGFRNLVVLDDFELDRSELLERVGDAPWFVAERWIHTRLPDGPTLVFASAKTPLRASMWTPRGRGDARIVFVPDQARDPELSDATLRNRHSGRTVGLLEFIGRLTA